MLERVCIFPCGGIKKIESTTARIAAYMVNEDLLPGKTMILCVPAFLRGVEEDLVMVEDYPTVVIDCHEESCATKIFYLTGLTPAARIFIPEIVQAYNLSCGNKRRELEPESIELAETVARETAKTAAAMLENAGYNYVKQQINTETLLAQGDIPDDPFEYIRVSPGIYRPAGMPDFFPKEREI